MLWHRQQDWDWEGGSGTPSKLLTTSLDTVAFHFLRAGTVVGEMEGQEDKVGQMKRWLRDVGSPKSRIDNTVFSEDRKIDKLSLKDFVIRK